MLSVKPIQTKIYHQNWLLRDFLLESLQGLDLEGQILAVTSKIVSVSEKRFVEKNINKEELVRRESDHYIGKCAYDCHLTIKEGLLIPSAGIDESNSSEDLYILFPENPFESAKKIYRMLKQELRLEKFGVLLTDSHTTPLRRGVVGAALAYYGFWGVKNKVGSRDLFGRELKMTQVDIADALATSAVLVMGEGDERCPLALLSYPVEFDELPDNSELRIPLSEDLYEPLITKKI